MNLVSDHQQRNKLSVLFKFHLVPGFQHYVSVHPYPFRSAVAVPVPWR